jgi:hypothetical protein
MGGEIDWAALPVIAEMFGIDDVEELIVQLVEIREFSRRE